MVKLLLAEVNTYIESLSGPLNKQTWTNIAVSMNTSGHNITADNCHIKWTGMKKKYKTIKDAKNQSGAGKQSWEYFDMINDILGKNPTMKPLSIASNIRGFTINQDVNNSSDEECEGNEENISNVTSSNVINNRQIRKRKSRTSVWMAELMEQRERHHQDNYTQRERVLSLLQKHFKT